VRGVSEALREVRLDSMQGTGEVKWTSGAMVRVRTWVEGQCLVGWRSTLTRSAAQRSSSLCSALGGCGSAVSRYFGSVRHRNQSRSRTPNCTELETETEPKNQTTDFSVRFQFGVRFLVKKRPG